jgi:DNA-binding transcriptional MerR regulator
MPEDPYTIADLARLADVTPRTVRYYVHRGLLPSPEAAGPATRYGNRHLSRLRLIRRLQRDHLPLAEIRARLERVEDGEVERALAGAEPADVVPAMNTRDTLAFVRQLMTRAGVAPRLYGTPTPPADAQLPAGGPMPIDGFERVVPDAFPIRDAPGVPGPTGAPEPRPVTLPVSPAMLPALPSAPSGPSIGRQVADRSTWERLAITADVEIHVRRPLDRRTNKRVDQLSRIARELFEDEA